MTRRRTAAQKLVGWSILAGGIVVIIGIFLITRTVTSSKPAPAAVPAVSTAAVSSSQPPAPASSAPVSSASASSAPVPSAAASSQQPAPASSQAAASSALPQPAAPSAAASSQKLAVVDAEAMAQGARRDLLNKLIGQGVFTGIEPVGPARVGVTPLFQGLNPDLQQQFLAVVYAYVHNGAAATDALLVIDATNGKVIGNFTNEAGLKPA